MKNFLLVAIFCMSGLSGFAAEADPLELFMFSRVSCELLLMSEVPAIEATQKVHNHLVSTPHFVVSVNSSSAGFKALGLKANQAKKGAVFTVSEVDDMYSLQTENGTVGRPFSFPPLQIWWEMMLSREGLEAQMQGRRGPMPYLRPRFFPDNSAGVILDESHEMRPYLEVTGLFTDHATTTINLGVHVPCNSRLAKNSFDVLQTRTPTGWFCRVPIVTLISDTQANRERFRRSEEYLRENDTGFLR